MKKIFYFLSLIISFYACKPEDEIITRSPDDVLTFSTDTILFDTVFTTIRTATRRLRIYNNSKKAIEVNEVRIGKGAASNFSAFVNGQPINKDNQVVNNLFIRGGDSVMVLVQANIDATNQSNPLVIADSLIFVTNGQQQDVKIRAWGQDAIFLNDTVLPCNATWDSIKPYVLYNRILVDENCTLTIKEGSKIHAYNNAIIFVSGTLKVEGTLEKPVVFGGVRKEKQYENVPEQWLGIEFLNGSKGNIINYAIIKNAFRGIQLGRLKDTAPPDVIITNTIIKNMSESGLFCINPKRLSLLNSLIINCGKYQIIGVNGGNYEIFQNTFAYTNTLGFIRKEPSVVFSDLFAYDQPDRNYKLHLNFVNNIVTGRVEKEFYIVLHTPIADTLGIQNNILMLKTDEADPMNAYLDDSNIIMQQELKFKAAAAYDFRLDTTAVSPARDKGNAALVDLLKPVLGSDLDGKPRPVGGRPDIGAYEQQK